MMIEEAALELTRPEPVADREAEAPRRRRLPWSAALEVVVVLVLLVVVVLRLG